jgi:hypothetical protein
VSFYVSTATFFLLHCDEWDRVVALPRPITGNYGRRSFSKYGISYYTIHASIAKYGIDIQIVMPEMTKFKMFREKVNMDFMPTYSQRVITGCHYT